jgi:predicted nucleic acid-binding protein
MILYLDTSALVKRYFEERYSDELIFRWRKATEIVTSSVAYAETLASLYRKKREIPLEKEVIQRILEAFRLDWESFLRVEVTDELNDIIDRIIRRYPLRGFDAIHLASAVLVRESLPENFLFACFDQRLSQAARKEGLETFPRIPS